MPPELIILLVCIPAIFYGYSQWKRGRKLMTTGIVTEAVVVSNTYKRVGTSGGTYHPVVQYTTEKQETKTIELGRGYMPEKKVGTKLTVIYDPEHSYDVAVKSTFQLEIVPWLMIAFGLAGIVVSILGLTGVIHFTSK